MNEARNQVFTILLFDADDLNPILGLYGGCYSLQQPEGIGQRVFYTQSQRARMKGTFQYCTEDDIEDTTNDATELVNNFKNER